MSGIAGRTSWTVIAARVALDRVIHERDDYTTGADVYTSAHVAVNLVLSDLNRGCTGVAAITGFHSVAAVVRDLIGPGKDTGRVSIDSISEDAASCVVREHRITCSHE